MKILKNSWSKKEIQTLTCIMKNIAEKRGLCYNCTNCETYLYWTVHHLDSWVKRDQLLSLALLFLYLMLNMFRVLILPFSGACDLFVELFHGLYCLHTDTTPPQPNHNVTPTHNEPEQYNPWNNSTNKPQTPEDGCINIRNMLSIK